jgi:rare lipoprotein A
VGLVCVGLLVSACTCLPKGQADLDVGVKDRGLASWYGADFDGWSTASGEPYDMHALTGAHRTLPLGTIVRVVNVENGRHVYVRINDRGPYLNGRILDLSFAAARELDMERDGVSPVSLHVVGGQADFQWLHHISTSDSAPFSHLSEEGWDAAVWRPRPASDHRWGADVERQGATRVQFPVDMLHERRSRRIEEYVSPDGPDPSHPTQPFC